MEPSGFKVIRSNTSRNKLESVNEGLNPISGNRSYRLHKEVLEIWLKYRWEWETDQSLKVLGGNRKRCRGKTGQRLRLVGGN